MDLTEKYLGEAYKAGSGGGDIEALIIVLKGWADDLKIMVDNENYDGALKLVKNLKMKVLSDLEKEIKKVK